MKKELTILFFLLIIPSLISAVEIKFSQDSFQPSETLQAQITGNFVTLSIDNIDIFTGNKVHPEPVIKDLIKFNNIYYFYAILPKNEANYSLQINDALYTEKGELTNQPIILDLPVYYTNRSFLTINPGFIIVDDDSSISLTVESITSAQTINATFLATGESYTKFVPESTKETFSFTVPQLPPGQSTIIINQYQVPVFLIKKGMVREDIALEFIPYEIKDTFSKKYVAQVILKNAGTKNLTNIELSTTLPAKISPLVIELLEVNHIQIINVSFSFPQDNMTVDGAVIATINNQSFSMPVFLSPAIKNNPQNNISQQPIGGGMFSCSQLGVRCTESNAQCSGDTIESLEGPCCVGDCVPIETSNTKNIIGIILIILLILIVLFIIYKVIKKRKEKDVDDILEEKSERIKKRLKGEEVSGKLDRV